MFNLTDPRNYCCSLVFCRLWGSTWSWNVLALNATSHCTLSSSSLALNSQLSANRSLQSSFYTREVINSLTTVGYLLSSLGCGYVFGPYFDFYFELALETWAKASLTQSLWVHDPNHTHSLASIQAVRPARAPPDRMLPLQVQKWYHCILFGMPSLQLFTFLMFFYFFIFLYSKHS